MTLPHITTDSHCGCFICQSRAVTIVEQARRNVVCNIGQLTKLEIRQLNAAAAAGEIEKWRGHWYPEPGASFGIGPLKSCWGPLGAQAYINMT